MLTSGNRPGKARFARSTFATRGLRPYFPGRTWRTALDAKAFRGARGRSTSPIPRREESVFDTRHMHSRPDPDRVPDCLSCYHGARESIEAFNVDAKASPPALTWVGCVVGPPSRQFQFDGARCPVMAASPPPDIPRVTAGQKPPAGTDPVGAVWEWHAATGWNAVPGTEASGSMASRSRRMAGFFTCRRGVSKPCFVSNAARPTRSAMCCRCPFGSTTRG